MNYTTRNAQITEIIDYHPSDFRTVTGVYIHSRWDGSCNVMTHHENGSWMAKEWASYAYCIRFYKKQRSIRFNLIRVWTHPHNEEAVTLYKVKI